MVPNFYSSLIIMVKHTWINETNSSSNHGINKGYEDSTDE